MMAGNDVPGLNIRLPGARVYQRYYALWQWLMPSAATGFYHTVSGRRTSWKLGSRYKVLVNRPTISIHVWAMEEFKNGPTPFLLV